MRLLNPSPNLQVVTYTASAWRWSVFLATGRQPLTSPPLDPASFPVQNVAGAHVLYFKLHGLPGERRWYGVQATADGEIWQDAIDVNTVARFPNLAGAVVFAQSCYGGLSPMSRALLDAGASAVVGTSHKLKAGKLWPAWSDWIGRYFLQFLGEGRTVESALHLANTQAITNNKIPRGTELSLSITGDQERSFA